MDTAPSRRDGSPSGREMLANPSVRRHLTLATAATFGSFLQATALAKHVYDITGSALALGMLGLAEFLPAAVLVPFTGSMADRFDRRRVAAIGLVGEAACSAGLAWYTLSGPESATPLFLLATLFGTFRAFVTPAVRSLPPLVTPAGGLPRLIAMSSITWQAAMIIAPASSGFLYELDPALPYGSAMVLFLTSALLLVGLRLTRPQQRTPAEQSPSLRHAMEGLRMIRRNPVLFGAISLDLFAVLFGGAYALLPAIAEERLGVGNIGYGWLRAAPGFGALLVTLALAVRPVHRHVGRVMLASVGAFGAGTILFGLTTSFALAFVALMVVAGVDAVSVFIRGTIVPLATPDAMRGRVMAVENVFIGASNELGAFESGVTAHWLGVTPAIILGGSLTLGVVALWWRGFPALRDIDRFSDLEHAEG